MASDLLLYPGHFVKSGDPRSYLKFFIVIGSHRFRMATLSAMLPMAVYFSVPFHCYFGLRGLSNAAGLSQWPLLALPKGAEWILIARTLHASQEGRGLRPARDKVAFWTGPLIAKC